jgi:hypothetical protein
VGFGYGAVGFGVFGAAAACSSVMPGAVASKPGVILVMTPLSRVMWQVVVKFSGGSLLPGQN